MTGEKAPEVLIPFLLGLLFQLTQVTGQGESKVLIPFLLGLLFQLIAGVGDYAESKS